MPRIFIVLLVSVSFLHAEESCKQPPPEEMAKAAGVELPDLPWHLANVWWELEKPVEHFISLEMDVTIDRDIPSEYNLYISPCGLAKINGLQFYGGIQTHINGWANKESRERIYLGKGGIFSRWSADKTTPIGLDHVRMAANDCLVESAGYEGEFASVRRPFAWTQGTYTWRIEKGATENGFTWFTCLIQNEKGTRQEIGSLKFEGSDFTFWDRHTAFVEVYRTAKIPNSGIPKVNVTFGHPRLNGKKASLKRVHAFYPNQGVPDSPDCAWVIANGEGIKVEVGPIFRRDESKRRHDVPLEDVGKRTLTKISTPHFAMLVDTQDAGDLKEWGSKVGTLCVEWFPKITALLPSEGFVPPKEVTLHVDPQMKGVAHASKDKITVSADYVRNHSDDLGMMVHELTHVVQSYPAGGPSWLVEGIADYIRIVHFEPKAPRPKLTRFSSYKDAYKTTAIFLEWIENHHKPGMVKELNERLRQGRYREECWAEWSGKSVDELWAEFIRQTVSSPQE